MQSNTIGVLLRLPELRVLWHQEEEDRLEIAVVYTREGTPCPACGSPLTKEHDRKAQRKRDCSLWGRTIFLVLMKRRFRCLACGNVFTEPDEVFGARKRSSERFRQSLGRQATHRAMKKVAREQGVSESLVRRCRAEREDPSFS